mgnify:CR=1 FL=1
MAFIINIKAALLRKLTHKEQVDFNLKDTVSVLFMRYDRIGDMIISTPVFRELKLAYPKISISVLASKSNYEVLINNPYVDEIIINNKNTFIRDLKSLISLRRKKFDVCIEFDHSVVPHAIIRLKIINPKRIISVYKEGRYGVKGSDLKLYDFFTKNKKNIHSCDKWLETILPFGVIPKSSKYDLFFSSIQNQNAIFFLEKYAGKFLIGINLEGALSGKKINFIDLEKICKSLYLYDNNIQIFILTEPKKYLQVKQKIFQMRLNFVCLTYATNSILDVAAIINNLDLIISPDTSIIHVASAYNKPIVSIHEDNKDSFELFAPRSKVNRTVFAPTEKGINNFSIDLLLRYCHEIIKLHKA